MLIYQHECSLQKVVANGYYFAEAFLYYFKSIVYLFQNSSIYVLFALLLDISMEGSCCLASR